ncbi:MAG: hypothetical protein ACL93V_02725 [Candidatus Electrothrix sp. YB6]
MDSLIRNATLSLKLGIEDYQLDNPERALSAVRNITAGVLLLFKEKLRILSPTDSDEVLLKEKIKPVIADSDTVSFKGSGKKTVNVYQIEERFNALGVSVDWTRVKKIVKLRNNIEHYYAGESDARMRELITDTLLVIRDFLTTQLDMEPAEVLDEITWDAMLAVQEVYQKELSECHAETAKIVWPKDAMQSISKCLRCATCHSELLKPQDPDEQDIDALVFKCTSCGTINPFQDIVEAGIDEYLGGHAYIAAKEGGEPPYQTCPDCGLETYLIESDFCAACLYEREYKECLRCGNGISIDEQDFNGFCSYCDYIFDKERNR